MTVRKIITPPDPVLRTKARKVRNISDDTRRLIDDMIETMRVAPGIGLAAPQVGVGQRVIVVEFAEPEQAPDGAEPADEAEAIPEKPPRLYTLVNPEIVRHSQEKVSGVEACLSLPGLAGDVERYEKVTVKGLNRAGDTVKIKAESWLSRIFQHEIDHLDGVLFIDHAERVWRVEEDDEPQPTTAAD